MLVMGIRYMPMVVLLRRMMVRVTVLPGRHHPMRVCMVTVVMRMGMFVLKRLVRMLVPVRLK